MWYLRNQQILLFLCSYIFVSEIHRISFSEFGKWIDLLIGVIILYLIVEVSLSIYINVVLKNQSIESIWTIFPMII